MYGIAEKLSGAKKILMAMGYRRPPTNQTSQDSNQELRIEGEVDIVRVAKTAADLVILQCDLCLLRGNARSLARDNPEFEVKLSDILLARGVANQTYVDTYEGAIARAASRQYHLSSVPERPRISSAGHFGVPGELSAGSAPAIPEHTRIGHHKVDENQPPPLPARQHSSPRKASRLEALSDVTQRPTVPAHSPERAKRSPIRMANNVPAERRRSSEDILDQNGRYFAEQEYQSAPCERDLPAHNMDQRSSASERNLDQYHSAPCDRKDGPRGRSGNVGVKGATSMSEDTHEVLHERQHQQQEHYQRHHYQQQQQRGPETESGGRKESWESSITSSPMSVTNSMSISSFSQDLPRPDPNDLPDPVFDDETGFDVGNRYLLRHVSSSDMSCEGNRVGLYVNSSSTNTDQLLFSPDDSHLENHGKVFCERSENSDPATTNISKTVLNHRLAKHTSTGDGTVESSKRDLLQDKGAGNYRDMPSDGASDSIGSDGKKSLTSPLNSIGEKRKRDSPFTSFSDDAASEKTSSRTSVGGEVVVGRDGRTGGGNSLEKCLDDAGKVEGECRPRSVHVSEKRREDYTQKGEGATKEGATKEENTKKLADPKEFEKGAAGTEIGKSNTAVSHSKGQSEDNQWVCSYCTFINPVDKTICEVCSIPKKR